MVVNSHSSAVVLSIIPLVLLRFVVFCEPSVMMCYCLFIFIFIYMTASRVKKITSGPKAMVALIHPLVETWKQNVISNSGSLHQNSPIFASNFIYSITGSSYFNKIVYLLPMLGANLNAALVPLIDVLNAGPATSSNFTNSDYTQGTGLQGNGINKIINTNVYPSQLGTSSNGGYGYWENNISFGADSDMMGCYCNDSSRRYTLDMRTNPLEILFWGNPSGDSCAGHTLPSNSHYYGQRSSSANLRLYRSGALIASGSSNGATSMNERTIHVVGADEGGSGLTFWAGRCALTYMTDGTMSASEVADFHSCLAINLISATGK